MFPSHTQKMIADLSSVLFHSLWQGVMIGLVILGLQRLARPRSASLRYSIFVSGLWLMLSLPVFTWFGLPNHQVGRRVTLNEFQAKSSSIPESVRIVDLESLPFQYSNWQDQNSQSSSESKTFPVDSNQRAHSQPENLDSRGHTIWQQGYDFSLPSRMIVMTWGLGVALFSLRLIVGYLWIFRISASGSAIDAELFRRIESRFQNQKWRSAPRVFVSAKLNEAIAVGYLRPMVLVPLTWTTKMTPETLEAVIVHELTHIRRFDLWVILVQRVAETLLFFHPVVWWISKRISIERELCCDAESVRLLDSNVAYAEALEQVANYLFVESQAHSRQSGWLANTFSLHFGGQKMELLTRIQQTLKFSSHDQQLRSGRIRHGMAMLMIPIVILGTGFAVVQTYAGEPSLGRIIIKVATKKSPQKEAREPSQKKDAPAQRPQLLLLGSSVNSDAGLTGQFTFSDQQFQELISAPSLKQNNGMRIKHGNYSVKAQSIEVRKESNSVLLTQGRLTIRNGFDSVTLQADHIELQLVEDSDSSLIVPQRIRATGNVQLTSQDLPTRDSTTVIEDDVDLNLIRENKNLWVTNLQFKSKDSAVGPTQLIEAEKVARTPPDWTKLHNQALDKITEFDYVGSSLEDVLVAINKEHFRHRLVIDRQEFRKAGISLHEEVDCYFSGITLRNCLKLLLRPYGAAYYFENGNIVVSSKPKVTHHRVPRQYPVEQILNHEEFFIETEEVLDQARKVGQLIDFLQQAPSSPDRRVGWGQSTINFDSETQRVVIHAPQSHQVKIQQRLDLLNQFIQQERDKKFSLLFREIVSSISKQNNCINKFLLTYKEQQRVKLAREEIPRKLLQEISVNYENEKLSTLLKFVADHLGINVVVDEGALSEVGISSSEPISVHLENVAAETVLKVVLQSYGLKSVIEDEVLKITSRVRAEGELLVMVYSLSDLISETQSVEIELVRIMELIQSVVAPNQWDAVGGVGSLASHELTSSIVIRQTRGVHNEVAWLLQELKNVRMGNEPNQQLQEIPKQSETIEKLETLISLDVNEEPLSQTFKEIKKQLGVQLYIDQQGLLEAGETLNDQVSLKFKGTARRFFNLRDWGYQVYDNLIVVTSKQRAVQPLRVQFYSTRSKHFERRGLKAVCKEVKSKFGDASSWEINGGLGIATFDGESETLIIRQSDEVHKRISEYLK